MRGYPREGRLGDDQAVDPFAVIGGQGVGDRHPDIGAVQGEPRVLQRVHQRDQVAGEGSGVVPIPGLVG